MTDAPKFRCDRLEKLADYLDTVPEERFNMGTWRDEDVAPSCGFAGCAIGWAIHGRLFHDLVWYNSKAGSFRPTLRTNRLLDEYEAIGEVFGISSEEAENSLFGPDLEGTPKEVAERIRKFSDQKCRETANANK